MNLKSIRFVFANQASLMYPIKLKNPTLNLFIIQGISLLHEKAETFFSHTESTFTYHWPNLTANRTQYSSCHVNLSTSGIYFGSPFGRYPTFHTLTSVGRKKVLSVYEKNVSAFSCNSEVLQYQQIIHLFKESNIF